MHVHHRLQRKLSEIVDATMTGNAHFNSLQATGKEDVRGLRCWPTTWSKSYDDMPQATRVGKPRI